LQNYNARLSDFGLARDGPTGDKSHVSTRVMGTHGYAAPEYLATGTVSGLSNRVTCFFPFDATIFHKKKYTLLMDHIDQIQVIFSVRPLLGVAPYINGYKHY